MLDIDSFSEGKNIDGTLLNDDYTPPLIMLRTLSRNSKLAYLLLMRAPISKISILSFDLSS